jgi:hypothetical protein
MIDAINGLLDTPVEQDLANAVVVVVAAVAVYLLFVLLRSLLSA